MSKAVVTTPPVRRPLQHSLPTAVNQPIRQTMSTDEFQTLVTHVLKLFREEHLVELARTPLAESALVAAEFLNGEPVTPAARGRALQRILTWAIDELRPADAETDTDRASATLPLTPTARLYHLLRSYYLEHRTIEQTAEALHLAS
ncbi:MAG: hypothetical protein KDE19_06565, partial [Caldilineaceae bacterium]|nr:hypothetical protein [Caldilineaceae bacterium]